VVSGEKLRGPIGRVGKEDRKKCNMTFGWGGKRIFFRLVRKRGGVVLEKPRGGGRKWKGGKETKEKKKGTGGEPCPTEKQGITTGGLEKGNRRPNTTRRTVKSEKTWGRDPEGNKEFKLKTRRRKKGTWRGSGEGQETRRKLRVYVLVHQRKRNTFS